MKNLALTAIVALGVAVPSLATAQESRSLHSDKANEIFSQILAESAENE